MSTRQLDKDSRDSLVDIHSKKKGRIQDTDTKESQFRLVLNSDITATFTPIAFRDYHSDLKLSENSEKALHEVCPGEPGRPQDPISLPSKWILNSGPPSWSL